MPYCGMLLRSVIVFTLSCLLGPLITAAQPLEPRELVYRTAEGYAGGLDTLHLRYWKPSSSVGALPLIVWVHGGAFYAGSYRAMDTVCKRWAERGYLAVSVQYRLGYHAPPLLEPPYAYDRGEVVRACWRATQDVRMALRSIVEQTDLWTVDTTCVVLAGESAGSIIALQALIADPQDSTPIEAGPQPDVVRGTARTPRPDLGPIDPVGASPLPSVRVMLNRYGAIMHPHMLQADDVPALFSYHQRGDLVVSCGVAKGLWGLPLGVGDKFPVLYGSCAMENLLTEVGHPAALRDHWFVDGLGHELHIPWEVAAREYAFVEQHGCLVPTSVPDRTGSPPENPCSWIAYDVLGRMIVRGFGTRATAERDLAERSDRLLLVLFDDGRTMVMSGGVR